MEDSMTDTAQENLGSMAQEDFPVLETVAMMHLDTLANCNLDARSYHLARVASLVAMDAAPVSYLVNLAAASDAGLTIEDFQGVLVAIAPIVGSARITKAAGNVLRGLGLAEIAAEEAGTG
jgi:alkylhydroperoxidase/carboxymuconolactone decarboxylase family protein YurZ